MARSNFHRSRYLRYRGGPDPLAPPVDLKSVLGDMADDVLAGSSPQAALREFLRRGQQGTPGLDELRRRVLQRRRELLERNNFGKTFDEVRQLLDDAVLAERQQLARDLDDDARFAEMELANLSTATAEAVGELRDYQWRSDAARDKYQQISDLLGRELLDQRFSGMKQALENADDNDRQAISEMLADLNTLLQAHNAGRPTDELFDEFMAKHGDQFPEQPRTVEELIESLARRAAAAQQMFNSLTPEQQQELLALSQQAFGSGDLMAQLDQLDAQLRAARPDLDWDGSRPQGDGPGQGWGEATSVMADLADIDALAEQLSQQYSGANLADVDIDALARQLGDEAGVAAAQLAEIEKAMNEAGMLRRGAAGDIELSPKALRQLGQAIFRDVAQQLSARGGERTTRQSGLLGEPTGGARPWQFGDTEPWDVTGTITNAVLRSAATGTAVPPVTITTDDVVIRDTEARSRAAVALLVDISLSMAWEGRWVPMKRTALALNHLIRTRFRQDHLELITFGLRAQTRPVEELVTLEPDIGSQGTNLHHGLLLAERHFRRHPNAQPVLLIVTDGEPTAHLEQDGEPFFGYPPMRRTLGLTVAELDHVAALGTSISFFRLGDDPSLARFIDAIARRVGGRVVASDADGLGAAVVSDYLATRRKH